MDTDQRLKQIEEISKNARATWFSLLIALLFCGVTLLDVQDRDFFEYGAATKLPLIGVEVPVVGFFLSAPVLVLALYLYLHIYLAKLWRALAPPFAIEGEALDDRVYPWMLSDTALRLRPDAPKRDFGWVSFLVSLALGWAFAPVILTVFWVRSWPYHHEWLTLFLAALLLVSLAMGMRSWTRMYDWMKRGGEAGTSKLARPGVIPLIATTATAALLTLSWEKTEGPIYPTSWGFLSGLYPANLYRAELVQLPDDWEPREIAWQTHARQNRATVIDEIERDPPEAMARREDGTLDTVSREVEIGKRLKQGFNARRTAAIARLLKKDWQGVDLRRADLREANLSGLDMQDARMDGANLFMAQMEGANLRWAQMDGANLFMAQMEGVTLIDAQMEGVTLIDAQMDGANLSRAQMKGANLSRAQMDGANLRRAQMDGANLRRAQMDGADLSFAQMEGANLTEARITEAILRYASVIRADIRGAEGLTQDRLDTMFGDSATQLLDGLTRPSHWATDEIPSDQAYPRWRTWVIEEMGVNERYIPSKS